MERQDKGVWDTSAFVVIVVDMIRILWILCSICDLEVLIYGVLWGYTYIPCTPVATTTYVYSDVLHSRAPPRVPEVQIGRGLRGVSFGTTCPKRSCGVHVDYALDRAYSAPRSPVHQFYSIAVCIFVCKKAVSVRVQPKHSELI